MPIRASGAHFALVVSAADSSCRRRRGTVFSCDERLFSCDERLLLPFNTAVKSRSARSLVNRLDWIEMENGMVALFPSSNWCGLFDSPDLRVTAGAWSVKGSHRSNSEDCQFVSPERGDSAVSSLGADVRNRIGGTLPSQPR